MALYQPLNSKEEIEANDLVKIRHYDGWNGGSWNVDFKILVLHKFKFFIENPNGGLYQLENPIPYTKSGVDYDMGHEYTWKIDSLKFKLKLEIGIYIEVTVEELIKGGNTVFYLKKKLEVNND